jgi:hypothetical protein
MKCKLLVFLLLVIPLIGFSEGIKVKKYKNAGEYSPIEPGKVKVLDKKPEAKHILLGEIGFVPPLKMSKKEIDKIMVAEAAKIGAEAIYYRIDIKYFRPKPRPGGRLTRRYKRKVRTGIALRFVK